MIKHKPMTHIANDLYYSERAVGALSTKQFTILRENNNYGESTFYSIVCAIEEKDLEDFIRKERGQI